MFLLNIFSLDYWDAKVLKTIENISNLRFARVKTLRIFAPRFWDVKVLRRQRISQEDKEHR